MKDLFLTLLQMSVTAGWLVLAACLFRLIFKKAPKFLRCVLWGLVALRLVLPFSVESVFSVVPKTDTASFFQKSISPASSAPGVKDALPVIENTFVINAGGERASSLVPDYLGVISVIWLSGVILMLIYALLSFILLKRKVADAVKLEKNVYESAVSSPFVLGLLFPKIYIPFGIPENEREFVLRHERAHIQRGDHWYKPIGFILLSVYWFNPLMWLAFVLFCRDIELACDEKVIKQYGSEELKAYSGALLSLSVSRKIISACPVAFGETNVKSRIKNVLSYKKPAFWIIIAAIAACLAVTVCLLTDPKDKRAEDARGDPAADDIIYDGKEPDYFRGRFAAFDSAEWDIDGDGKKENCYLGFGPTSGLFTFTFYAEKQDSDVFYLNIFLSDHGTLSFEKSALGNKLFVQLDRSQYGEDARLYDISVRDGNIVLSDPDGEIANWGPSGVEAKAFLSGAYIEQGENGYVDSNDPSWGIKLTAENVTPTGMKLTLSQEGGENGDGFYTFGQHYRIDVYMEEEELWMPLPREGVFTTEALVISSGGSYEWDLDWFSIYGALENSYSCGLYRLSKDVSFSERGFPDKGDSKTFYAYFEVPVGSEGEISEDLDADLDGDGKNEQFRLRPLGDGMFSLRLIDGGKTVWKMSLGLDDKDRKAFYICNDGKKSHILEFCPQLIGSIANYSYRLYEYNGKKLKKVDSAMVSFEINGRTHLPVEEIAAFCDRVNALLENSTGIAGTMNGVLNAGDTNIESAFLWLREGQWWLLGNETFAERLQKYDERAYNDYHSADS